MVLLLAAGVTVEVARIVVLNAVKTGLPDGTVTRTWMFAEFPKAIANDTVPPLDTSVYDVPPLVEISTVKPAGITGALRVKVSFELPLLSRVLT